MQSPIFEHGRSRGRSDGHCYVRHLCLALVGVVGFGVAVSGCDDEDVLASGDDADAFNAQCEADYREASGNDEWAFQSTLRKGEAGARVGQSDYCRDPANRCTVGEGNCRKGECAAGLTCVRDAGARYALSPTVDVCMPTHCQNQTLDAGAGETDVDCGGDCGSCERPATWKNGSTIFCSAAFPCESGEGSCGGASRPCAAGLVCAVGNGPRFGISRPECNVCVPPHCVNGLRDDAEGEAGVDCGGACGSCARPSSLENGATGYCSALFLCGDGEGNCRGDAECLEGHTCEADRGAEFGLRASVDVCVGDTPQCTAPARPASAATVQIQLTQVFAGATVPITLAMIQHPTVDTRWYTLQKRGTISTFDSAASPVTVTTALDYRSKVTSTSEMGLLGLAFHPNFASNGKVYVSYNDLTRRSVISEFLIASDGVRLDAATERMLLTWQQPATNHNGGTIAFGRDGYLYIGFGDGGGSSDVYGNGQRLETVLGKFIRIDVNRTDPVRGFEYGIPEDNPFAAGGGRPEIFAIGFRNPWKWSFDMLTGDLWAGDVGQGAIEEVDVVRKGGNYGWSVKEGTRCFNPPGACSSVGLINPVVEYGRTDGRSITGGYVYHGSAIPALRGTYIYADFVSGNIFAALPDGVSGKLKHTKLLAGSGQPFAAFGQDRAGEMYVIAIEAGTIYRIDPAPSSPSGGEFPATLSASHCALPAAGKTPRNGIVPYAMRWPFWSDGAVKTRGFALPEGEKIAIEADGDLTFPKGSVIVKQFALGGKPVETRLLVRHDDGGWAGYSYEWRADGSDADLLDAGKTKQIGDVTWVYPSRTQCMECHTAAAGHTLGLELAQLEMPVTVGTTQIANQLTHWQSLGYFERAFTASDDAVARLPVIGSAGTGVEEAARAQLHVNCAMCHRAGGPTQSAMDLRFATPVATMKVCDVAPTQGSLGITDARLLAPGSAERSMLVERMSRRDFAMMPPLGSTVVDDDGVGRVAAWAEQLTACPSP